MSTTPERLQPPLARWAWSLVLPIGALTVMAIFYVAPLVTPPEAGPEQIEAAFTERCVPFCHPKGLEERRYLMAVAVPALLFFGALRWCRRKETEGGRWKRLADISAEAAPWTLLLYVGAMLLFQGGGKGTFWFFSPATLGAAFALVVMVHFGARLWERGMRLRVAASWGNWKGKRAEAWAAGAAAILTTIYLLPCLNFDNTIAYHAGQVALQELINFHLPFNLDEFGGVANGRTPLVDFFPQYQNVTPLLLEPYFKLVGIHVGTFTVAMMVLFLCGMMSVYFVFRSLAATPLWALALYVPYVVGGINISAQKPFFYISQFCAFMVPLRYLGPWLTLFLFNRYLQRPTTGRMAGLFAVGALAAVNNLDFGIAACIAAVVGVALTSPQGLVPGRRFAGRVGLVFILSTGAALAAFCGDAWLRTGRWPDFSMISLFQRAFAIDGFFMVSMPRFGFHHLMYLVLTAALWVGLIRLARPAASADEAPEERRLAGLLVFGAVFGFGAALYYVGRSIPGNLSALYLVALFPLMLLVYASFRDGTPSRWRVLSRGPAIFLLAFAYVLPLTSLKNFPLPWWTIERLFHFNATLPARHLQLVQLIRNTARPGEKVMIAYPYESALAEEAGVKNLYPFPAADSLILKEQVELVGRTIDATGITKFYYYGPPSSIPEMEQALAARGFHGRALVEPNPTFQLWEKD